VLTRTVREAESGRQLAESRLADTAHLQAQTEAQLQVLRRRLEEEMSTEDRDFGQLTPGFSVYLLSPLCSPISPYRLSVAATVANFPLSSSLPIQRRLFFNYYHHSCRPSSLQAIAWRADFDLW